MSKEKLKEIVQRAATDLDFRRRLISTPQTVLMEEGFDVPQGKKVVILENSDDHLYMVLPPLKGEKKLTGSPVNCRFEKDTAFLSGRLDANGVEKIRSTLLDRKGSLVIDLTGLEYISSAGLSLFLMIRKELEKSGHSVKIVHVKPAVRNVFILAGMDQLFQL